MTTNRPVFAVQYDSRLPSIPKIQNNHWRAVTSQDQYLSEGFKSPPRIVFKKQINLREHLIRANAPPPVRPHKRYVRGIIKCGKQCTEFPFIQEVRKITNKQNTCRNEKNPNCESINTVYLIECKKDRC